MRAAREVPPADPKLLRDPVANKMEGHPSTGRGFGRRSYRPKYVWNALVEGLTRLEDVKPDVSVRAT